MGMFTDVGDLQLSEAKLDFMHEIFQITARDKFPNLIGLISKVMASDRGWQSVIRLINIALQLANFVHIEPGKLVEKSNGLALLVIPAPLNTHRLVIPLLKWMLDLMNKEAENKPKHDSVENLASMLSKIQRMSIPASNVPHFLKASVELNIPTIEIVGKVIQFGYGSKARWLDSTFTDKTSQISAGIARNKLMTSKILSDAGFPVAANALVANSDQAVKVADKLGYPVVVKPVDLDGGAGVAAGLMNAKEVIKAYDLAKKYSKSIMVEKHVDGRDYRLNIFNNELLWAIERVPAGVVGDGIHKITELVEIANRDSRRGQGIHAKMKWLELDDEALDLLRSKNVTVDTVLSNGQYMPLRRRANVSSGGTPVAVMDKVHPDNRILAIRAAAALGLDIAGVDLLIPDISQSWLETGCAICEINGQPQLGSVTSAHVYAYLLQHLVSGNGRIPITLIVGANKGEEAKKIVFDYTASGLKVGFAGQNAIYVGRQIVSKKYVSPFHAGNILLRDRTIDAIVMEINDFSFIRSGLPFDRFDQLIVAGENMLFPRDIKDSEKQYLMDKLLKTIRFNQNVSN